MGRDSITVCIIWNQWFREGHMVRRAASKQPSITNWIEDRSVMRMAFMGQTITPQFRVKKSVLFNNKYLHEQLYNVCSSMGSSICDNSFSYSWCFALKTFWTFDLLKRPSHFCCFKAYSSTRWALQFCTFQQDNARTLVSVPQAFFLIQKMFCYRDDY